MCLFGVVDEEVHPIEEIHLADACIGIQKEQIDLGIKFFDAFVHAFGDYMIGDTAERLQAEYIVYSILDKSGDFSSNQPAFAVLVVKGHNFLRPFGDILDAVMRSVIAESRHDFTDVAEKTVDQPFPQE